MGEYPYLPETNLLDALVEQQHRDKIDKDDVARVLVETGLAKLVPLIGRRGKWEQELGIEDRQRLGFAIAILRKPSWILMHEATSALIRFPAD
jgi:putative ATP-binding cassette transporter